MSALLHLMMGSGRRKQLVTRTFTSNITFQVPASVTVFTSASGKGADGRPAGGNVYRYSTTITTSYIRRDSGPPFQVVRTVSGWPYGSEAYCDDAVQDPDSTVYYGSITCYSPKMELVDSGSPTTGDSSTGFGKIFPGGNGGPASITTFNNVAVTPNASYSIVVPSGGSITITYEI